MQIIEVKQFNPMPGNEYNASSYPGNGVYLSSTGMTYVVNNGMVMMFAGAANLIKDAAEVGSGGPSESFILKALAIAQNPQLAAELTR